jgi:hypothetical protein
MIPLEELIQDNITTLDIRKTILFLLTIELQELLMYHMKSILLSVEEQISHHYQLKMYMMVSA